MAKLFGRELNIEFMTRMPQKQKLLVFAGTIILIVILYLWQWYFPVREEITNYENQKVELEKKLESLQKVQKEIDKFKAEIAALTSQYQKQSEILPPEEELPTLLISIADLSKETGVMIKAFTPGALQNLGNYQEMGVNLKLSGNFHSLATFIDRIGKLKRIVNVENVTFGEPALNNGKILLNSECDLKIFSRP
ncbi:MAG: hypothetical protein A3C43_03605 [Candidatus Schekmanbacteria bacterium RIFCSPHIGHO2_02_FULL_38_11]|uniref:Pilus assembly protein PilO n=1 Tax=Candidatus Schekmanbacteria bacterium RIFCSPLOWO2_12_FULL_38_15 TaxID=1817883 RepID=A0A1F7SK68_9BACT|nr:MAG: hypothetical protein A2043_08845 [Candidatus Schekmanbacteria bacterium GWA2_38_9]OGL49991.1 MAG: hypothetical protein A3C43_03605 [Candidatus Schekmanbacteria bacterium RIFCSPHIGHO2_02_FULL_38_11]OGL51225.1 MAG: hypothetical protein A3H37_10445 [Candidatus Schekmanbacteria bacterium RIFCSPLOWO2_02_FULL_38_14]OGL54176.1 MAG: hypothetical protein A3G31_05285 [Candidatus Schekmanbacteria bacterium RIFCSPLOWO2_12_FULL_38_15]